MIDKHAHTAVSLVDQDANRSIGGLGDHEANQDQRVQLKMLDEYTLILSIHQKQTQEVLDCLKSNGIEAFPEEEPYSFSDYGMLYIPTLHPETDIIAYQKVLDDAE